MEVGWEIRGNAAERLLALLFLFRHFHRRLRDLRRRFLRRRVDVHDLEVLAGLSEELSETHDARGSHGDAGVDRQNGHAGTIGNDARGEIEIDFFGTDTYQNVVRVARLEIVVTNLKDLLVGGLVGHRGALLASLCTLCNC